MSWLSEWTGKAGAFLERVDQAAGTSLQGAGLVTPSPNRNTRQPASFSTGKEPITTPSRDAVPYEPTTHAQQPWTTPSQRGAAVAQALVGSASTSSLFIRTPASASPTTTQTKVTTPSSPTSTSTSTNKSLVSDDSLFEFLNSPTPTNSGNKTNRHQPQVSPLTIVTKPPIIGEKKFPRPHSSPVLTHPPANLEREKAKMKRNDAISHSQPEGERKEEEEEEEEEKDKRSHDAVQMEDTDGVSVVIEDISSHNHSNSPSLRSTPPAQEKQMGDVEEGVINIAIHGGNEDTLKQKISNFELENKLMKREVNALNEELSSVMSRLNETSQSTAHYESEIHALREQASRSDHVIRQLRSHEEDLQATVEARDSQIQVLRTQLEAADKAVQDSKEDLSRSRKEQERLLQDANLSSGAHNQALESLKVQLSQVQAQLAKEKEERKIERVGFIERESLLQSEQRQLSDSLAASQRQVAAEQRKSRESQTAMQNTQRELQLLRKEHEEYKQRAAGILQAKEKLISSLQHGGESGGVVGEARLEEVQLEKEHLQAQLNSALQQLEGVKSDMQELEERSGGELESVLEQVRVCEGVLAEERKQHASAREDLTRLNQELEMIREDLFKEKTAHREDTSARDTELANLKLQMTSLTPGKAELEARLHELTESLIQKQTTLEALNSERSTLNVQLQRLQGDLAEAHKSKANSLHTAIRVNGMEQNSPASESLHVRSMSSVIPSLEHAPSDSRLHNVRRAVNTVDRFSIRLGVFLKRYPQARLFVLIYVLLLHVWVMIVLLTYSPEVHANEP